jgi:hypothetical protein
VNAKDWILSTVFDDPQLIRLGSIWNGRWVWQLNGRARDEIEEGEERAREG